MPICKSCIRCLSDGNKDEKQPTIKVRRASGSNTILTQKQYIGYSFPPSLPYLLLYLYLNTQNTKCNLDLFCNYMRTMHKRCMYSHSRSLTRCLSLELTSWKSASFLWLTFSCLQFSLPCVLATSLTHYIRKKVSWFAIAFSCVRQHAPSCMH